MNKFYIPFHPLLALTVLFLIILTFAWAGSDETRLERSCMRFVQSAAACRRF